jgi:hypothetical protein
MVYRYLPLFHALHNAPYQILGASDVDIPERPAPFLAPRTPKRGQQEKISGSLCFRRAWCRVGAMADVPFAVA